MFLTDNLRNGHSRYYLLYSRIFVKLYCEDVYGFLKTETLLNAQGVRYNKMANNEKHVGSIYILTNPSFPEYVKIGYADDVEQRVSVLNSSASVPFAFRVYATYDVDTKLSDKKLHSILDTLNPDLRSIDDIDGKQRKREFFALEAEDAYKILEAIAVMHGLENRLKK
jgi:hypothetical protein